MDLPAGFYRVEVSHDGFGPFTGSSDVHVTPGQRVRLREILMREIATIRGRVLDAEGKGMPGIPVELLRIGTDETGRKVWGAVSSRVLTDAEGVYRTRVPGSGDYYVRAVQVPFLSPDDH